MEIHIRQANPEDAPQAAELLAATMDEYGVMTLGLGDPQRQLKVLAFWFQKPGNRFSYERTWLAETDGEIAGLLLTLGGKELPASENALAKGIFQLYNPIELMRMLWRLSVLGRTNEASADEYVLAHLAVNEKFRRMGVALQLMEKAEAEARIDRYQKICLEVEIGNVPAETLYQKCGYSRTITTEFTRHAQVLHCPGYFHMVKTL
jgi:ribosomal protein S18 acetylase RimI-like enzyme